MIILNKRGNVLQIVLILFLTLTYLLTQSLDILKQKAYSDKQIMIMEKQQNYEILLSYYYKKMIANDILFSEEFDFNGYSFISEVNVDVNSYIISTYFEHPYFNYTFLLEIDNNTFLITNFEYRKD